MIDCIQYGVPVMTYLLDLFAYFYIDELMHGSCEVSRYGCLRQIGAPFITLISLIGATIFYYIIINSKLSKFKISEKLFLFILIIFLYVLLNIALIWLLN